MTVAPGDIEIRISNALRADAAASSSRVSSGIDGLRDRVEALGGHFGAGRVGTDRVVRATVPRTIDGPSATTGQATARQALS